MTAKITAAAIFVVVVVDSFTFGWCFGVVFLFVS